jgi:hypothetical protein
MMLFPTTCGCGEAESVSCSMSAPGAAPSATKRGGSNLVLDDGGEWREDAYERPTTLTDDAFRVWMSSAMAGASLIVSRVFATIGVRCRKQGIFYH